MPDGLEFPLSKTQVYWVMGIPAGPKIVPFYGDDDVCSDEVKRFFDVYGYTSRSGVRGIKASVIKQIIEGEISSDAEFKKAFLMMALNDLICPTTCQRLAVSMLYAAFVAERAHEYDWCSLLLDHLMNAIGGFSKRFYLDGFAKGCGGRTMFLAEMSRCSAGISTKSTKSKRRRMKKNSPVHEDRVHEDRVHEDPVHEGPVHGPVHEGVVHEEVAEQQPELENETGPNDGLGENETLHLREVIHVIGQNNNFGQDDPVCGSQEEGSKYCWEGCIGEMFVNNVVGGSGSNSIEAIGEEVGGNGSQGIGEQQGVGLVGEGVGNNEDEDEDEDEDEGG
ncbi:hypothetical protein BVRB_6g141220 [Beta vulgaris subsp. vulgaris]|nr:hypothetical protein BVRB_6g141220 [Beta vulgaris subsp. vulgaris]